MWSDEELDQYRLHLLWLEGDIEGERLDWTGKVFPSGISEQLDLRFAILDKSIISGYHNLDNASLKNANLAKYDGLSIINADITSGIIGNTKNFTDCKLTAVDFGYGSGLGITRCEFSPIDKNNRYIQSRFDNCNIKLNQIDKYADIIMSGCFVEGDLNQGELIRCTFNDTTYNAQITNSKISGSKFYRHVLGLQNVLARDVYITDCIIGAANSNIEGKFTNSVFNNTSGILEGEATKTVFTKVNFDSCKFNVDINDCIIEECIIPKGRYKNKIDNTIIVKTALTQIIFPEASGLNIDAQFDAVKFDYLTSSTLSGSGDIVVSGVGNYFYDLVINGSGVSEGQFYRCKTNNCFGSFVDSKINISSAKVLANGCEITGSGYNVIEAYNSVFPSGLSGFNRVSGTGNTFLGKYEGIFVTTSGRSSYVGDTITADTANSVFDNNDLSLAKLTGIHSNSSYNGANLTGTVYLIKPEPENPYEDILS